MEKSEIVYVPGVEVGKTLIFEGVLLEVNVWDENNLDLCTGCYFDKNSFECIGTNCNSEERPDGKDVFYKVI